jgi:hypothetical protein
MLNDWNDQRKISSCYNLEAKAGVSKAMKGDLRRRWCMICGSNFLPLYFQSSRHSVIPDAIFSLRIL